MHPRTIISAKTVALATALALGGAAPAARAHNGSVHQNMPDLAWQIMKGAAWEYNGRAMKKNPVDLTPPPNFIKEPYARPMGIAQADWDAFLAVISAGIPRLRGLPSGVKAASAPSTCADFPTFPPSFPETTLGALTTPLGVDYVTNQSNCTALKDWRPGGIYRTFARRIAGEGDLDVTGLTLGLHAATPDYLPEESRFQFNISSAGFLGDAKKLISDFHEVAILPLYALACAGEEIASWFGAGDGCPSYDDFTKSTDPNRIAETYLPMGIGNFHQRDDATLWHFMNLQDGATNEFDDHQGMLYSEAGLQQLLDPVDLGIHIYWAALGISVHHETSEGVQHYQIEADDGHQNSAARDRVDWEMFTADVTPFSPLDNLGHYGWARFKADPQHSASWLGWPLHALGDAVAPHHLIGSSGYGHRPFEDAVDHQWLAIRFVPDPAKDPVGDVVAQTAQVQRILAQAYRWRRLILDWRQKHPGNDVPVRDLITAVGKETFAEVGQSGWAYHGPAASTRYEASEGGKGDTIADYAGETAHMQPLIERGVAATIAFLMSSVEVLP